VVGDAAADKAAAIARRRGAAGPALTRARSQRPPYPSPAPIKRILAIEAGTGDLVWRKSDADTAELMPTTLAASSDRVFFQSTKEVICLDAGSGRELWRQARPVSLSRPAWSAPTLVVHDDVLLSADRAVLAQEQEQLAGSRQVEWIVTSSGGDAPPGDLVAFSAKTGKMLWTCKCREVYNAPVDVLVADGLVWTGDMVRSRDPGVTVARNPATGDIRRERPADEASFQVGCAHHRCYRNKATDRYLVLGRAGVEFIELASGKGVANHWVRGTCQYGILPCNGLLYAPPHSCACYIQAKLNGFNALAPKRESRPSKQTGRSDHRLERGPAYDQPAGPQAPGEADWPAYRHDPARSGRTKSPVPADLEPMWHTDLGGRLSSVVIGDGKLFVAQIDAHTVHALGARDGKPLWSYTAGSRVDSPPTIHQGLALFGSADGWVYCLRASDGQLVWRFRAAPAERRVAAYGQLESAWPVHGSVLVQGGVAYCAAGRSSFLDGGIYLYRLDPKTGKTLSKTCIDSRDPQTGREPQESIQGLEMLGALPDLLSSDGASIYMRHMRFDLTGTVQEPGVPHLFSSVGFLDDTWWHRTYWFIGTAMACGYGGWPQVGNQVPAGRLLVSDEASVYGFGRNQYAHHGSHVGLDAAKVFHFRPERDAGTRLTHYRLFAADRRVEQVNAPARKPATGPAGTRVKEKAPGPAKTRVRFHWSREVPLLVRAMVLADKTLFIAGPPDVLGREEVFRGSADADTREKLDERSAAGQDRRGALLWVVGASDGRTQAQYNLQSPPVWDGMAAANGRLYLSTTDGRISCFAGR